MTGWVAQHEFHTIATPFVRFVHAGGREDVTAFRGSAEDVPVPSLTCPPLHAENRRARRYVPSPVDSSSNDTVSVIDPSFTVSSRLPWSSLWISARCL